MDVLPLIRDFLQTHRNIAPERVVPEALLKELEIDSLLLLELIFECEESLGIKIDQNTATPTTIAELVAAMERPPKGVR